MSNFRGIGDIADQAINRARARVQKVANRTKETVVGTVGNIANLANTAGAASRFAQDVKTRVEVLSLRAALERVAREYNLSVEEIHRRLQNKTE